jgi:hypothetical protein
MRTDKLLQEIDNCISTVANRLKNVKQDAPTTDMLTMAQSLAVLVDTRGRALTQESK